MLYRGQCLTTAEALALLHERDATIERMHDEADERWRELVRLRAPQTGMVQALLYGAGVTGEPTIEQWTIASDAYRDSYKCPTLMRGSWFDLCADVRQRLGLPPEVTPAPKRKRSKANAQL